MDSFPEHKPKQVSHTKPIIEEIEEWGADQLLDWIDRNCLKVTELINSRRQKSQGGLS